MLIKEYNEAYEKYKNKFGETDLKKYLSTWDYNEQQFVELANKLNTCIEKNKTYKKLFVPLWMKIFNGLFYKIYNSTIDE